MLEQNNNHKSNSELPDIPGKRYFTIGEVSELCAVKPHVLRYWEQEFPQLKPTKRRGNRRYYQQHDVLIVRSIRGLLYEEGFTIGGARQKLSEPKSATAPQPPAPTASSRSDQQIVSELCRELEDLLAELNS